MISDQFGSGGRRLEDNRGINLLGSDNAGRHLNGVKDFAAFARFDGENDAGLGVNENFLANFKHFPSPPSGAAVGRPGLPTPTTPHLSVS